MNVHFVRLIYGISLLGLACRQLVPLLLSALVLSGLAEAADRTERVVVPDDAYPTGASYGTGWKCNFGFEKQREQCVAIVLPENAFLTERGDRWRCERGYRESDTGCVKIAVPENGYLDDSAQSDWQCDRGYQATRDDCMLINVPANAYLNNESYGKLWTCDRGYRQTETECEKIPVPDNAYLVDRNYGPGWQCERGYAASREQSCLKVEVPANAHLNREGDDWECNLPYRLLGNECLAR